MTTKLRAASFQDGAVTNAKLAGSIASAKLVQGSDFLTSIPIVTGDVIQRVSSQAETYSGSTIHWDSGSSLITETTAWNSSSLTPLVSLSITAKRADSKFVIELIGKFNISTGYRSQISLQDTYSAGSFDYANNLYYSHYGLYNATGGDYWNPGGYRVDDPRSLAAGASRTYHWFGGSISGGTQKYWNLNMSITEVAT